LQVASREQRGYAAKRWRARRRCALIRIKAGALSRSPPSQVVAVITDPLFYLLAIPPSSRSVSAREASRA